MLSPCQGPRTSPAQQVSTTRVDSPTRTKRWVDDQHRSDPAGGLGALDVAEQRGLANLDRWLGAMIEKAERATKGRASDLDLSLTLDLVREIEFTPGLGLAYDVRAARSLARDVRRAVDHNGLRDPISAHAAIRTLARSLYRVQRLIRQRLDLMNAPSPRAALAGTHCSARRLTAWSAQLVPAEWRDRYLEEFEAELCDLLGTSRRRQLAHAVRVLAQSVMLRWELQRSRQAASAWDAD